MRTLNHLHLWHWESGCAILIVNHWNPLIQQMNNISIWHHDNTITTGFFSFHLSMLSSSVNLTTVMVSLQVCEKSIRKLQQIQSQWAARGSSLTPRRKCIIELQFLDIYTFLIYCYIMKHPDPSGNLVEAAFSVLCSSHLEQINSELQVWTTPSCLPLPYSESNNKATYFLHCTVTLFLVCFFLLLHLNFFFQNVFFMMLLLLM